MKALLARTLSVFLVFGSSLAQAGTVLPLPGVNGPFLGDPTTNLFSIEQSLQNYTFSNFTSFTTLTVFAGPITATQLQYGINFLTAASGTTVSVVLPPAKSAAEVFIANNTAQGLSVFGTSPTNTIPAAGAGGPGVGPGNQDFINGTIGTTPYSMKLNANLVQCFVAQLGSWWCFSGT